MDDAPGPDTALNWMQQYAANEMVELQHEGKLTRREMMGRLVAICGSAAAATTFLASCASDSTSTTGNGATSSAPRTSSSGADSGTGTNVPPATSKPAGKVTPPTNGGAGHPLSVAADDPDVKAGNVTFKGPASDLFGYLARPATSGSRPGIIVNHEIFGLTDHIRDVARRLAKVGYVALAVDLASRAGGTDKAPNPMGALTQGSPDDRIADLNAGIDHLKGQEDVNGKIGVVGFCFGGGMTLSLAAANPTLLAAVAYYGPTPQPPSIMSGTKAAVLAHYGADDKMVNGGIEALEAAMQGKTFEKHVYEGAGHAFNNDSGGAYNEKAAVEAWTTTLGWFARYLV
jgi:carboxymethylenebutenolidase